MEDRRSPASVGRHTLESTVSVGGGPDHLELEKGETNLILADVDIEISGSDSDRPYTYELLEAIEDAVVETIEEFDRGDE